MCLRRSQRKDRHVSRGGQQGNGSAVELVGKERQRSPVPGGGRQWASAKPLAQRTSVASRGALATGGAANVQRPRATSAACPKTRTSAGTSCHRAREAPVAVAEAPTAAYRIPAHCYEMISGKAPETLSLRGRGWASEHDDVCLGLAGGFYSRGRRGLRLGGKSSLARSAKTGKPPGCPPR
jgi:hypothetical protein